MNKPAADGDGHNHGKSDNMPKDLQQFLRQTYEQPPNDVVKTGLREKPDVTYVPEHVYGYSGDRYRSVLYFGKDNNEIVYPAAAMGIVQDLTTRE